MSAKSPSRPYAPDDITGLARDVADAKTAAARARVAGRVLDAPDSRTVYLDTCATIAKAFEHLGYKFSKSGPHMTAKSRDRQFAYYIGFQSSVHNIPGQHVKLLVHVAISSPAVKKWEAALWARYGETYQGSGTIIGTQLGYLAPPAEHAWLTWELAHDDTRAAAIADVVARITRDALPWFAHCEDVPHLVEHIAETGSYPGSDVDNMPSHFPAELLLCFASQAQTTRALAAYVTRLHPKARANLYKDLATARAETPLRINYSGFHGCSTRYLIAEGIDFPAT